MSVRVEPARVRCLVSIIAVALALATLPAPPAAGEPDKTQLDAAREQLRSLEAEASVLVEEYNQVRLRLEQISDELERARARADELGGRAAEAQQALEDRAAVAYRIGPGEQLAVVLGSGSLSDMSDRMRFLSVIVEQNEAAALSADNASVMAERAQADLAHAQEDQRAEQRRLDEAKQLIEENIADRRALVQRYEIEYRAALEAARQRERKEAAEAIANPEAPAEAGGDGGGGGDGETYAAPPPSSAAATAVKVALAQVGDEYEWGGAGPDEFDCSGLTMYAWRKAGVSLPHSAAAQYASLPKVSRSQLQPGDLVFYGEGGGGISHVAMYIGGGRIVHAYSEGTPVSIDSFSSWWTEAYRGAARPG